MKRPWDDLPCPRTRREIGNIQSITPKPDIREYQTIKARKMTIFSESLERRLRAAEGLLSDLGNAIEYGTPDQVAVAVGKVAAHFAAAREEDQDAAHS